MGGFIGISEMKGKWINRSDVWVIHDMSAKNWLSTLT